MDLIIIIINYPQFNTHKTYYFLFLLCFSAKCMAARKSIRRIKCSQLHALRAWQPEGLRSVGHWSGLRRMVMERSVSLLPEIGKQ